MVTYLFNSTGEWICFKKGKHLFNTEGEWIGWFPWDDSEAVDTDGNYLGTIYRNRFIYFNNRPYRGYPGYPGYHDYPGYPGYPGFAGYLPLPANARDVILKKK